MFTIPFDFGEEKDTGGRRSGVTFDARLCRLRIQYLTFYLEDLSSFKEPNATNATRTKLCNT